MTSITIRSSIRAVYGAYLALGAFTEFLFTPLSSAIEASRDKKRVLETARPVKAYTDFSGYKEASIETRTVQDSRGRILAQVKLWIYLGERKCYREVTFLNHLLLASVGINRLSLAPLGVGKSDTPAAMLEITVRELECWLRNRTPGTQFGHEAARNAAAKPQPLRVVSVIPDEAPPAPVLKKPVVVPQHQPTQVPSQATEQRAAPQLPQAAFQRDPQMQSGQFQQAAPRPDIKAKAEEYTVGLLQSVGMQERTTNQRNFKQYCFDILLTDGDSRGMIKRLWGADLERALGESKALLGQTVEVCHHGSIPMPNSSGGSSYKNSYSMRVLK